MPEESPQDSVPVIHHSVKLVGRSENPLMLANRPWESAGINYITVLKIDGVWKMWYESFDDQSDVAGFDLQGFLCYAESRDGIVWTKSIQNRVEYNGSKRNNILLKIELPGTTVFYDKDAPNSSKYKLIYLKPNEQVGNWVFGMSSADGLAFSNPQTLMKSYSDTQLSMIRDNGIYRLYSRVWDGHIIGHGRRMVGYSESTSFGKTCFRTPKAILSNGNSEFDIYNNAAVKIKEGLYLMIPSLFSMTRDISVPHLALSENGINFRMSKEPLVPLGKGFDSSGIYIAPGGGIPGEKENEYIFYFVGKSEPHSANFSQLQSSYTGGVGRIVLRIE
ncbi:MAG TPA: hypothetical protein PKM91_08685 [Cyclobacteriaceae bacterium]|nr:hypothetical protein [Cyclobacteriaceae bacterium]